MKEKISIIIPVYNVSKYLQKNVESILNQTYSNFEIIYINDGSTDDSIEILKKYASKDKRIVIIDRNNKGAAYSRIEGVNKSTGDMIMFIDSDDWVEPNILEKMCEKMKKYKADVVRCSYFYNEEEIKTNSIVYEEDKLLDCNSQEFMDLFYKTNKCNSMWRQLFKKNLIKNYNSIETDITICDDLVFNISLFNNAKNVLFIPDYLYHYRENPNSITKNININRMKKNIKSCIIGYKIQYDNLYSIEKENLYGKFVAKTLIENTAFLILKLMENRNKSNKKEIDQFVKEIFDDIELNKMIKTIEVNEEVFSKHSLYVKSFIKKDYFKMKIYTNFAYKPIRFLKTYTKRVKK